MKSYILVFCSFMFLFYNSIVFADEKEIIDFEKLNKVFYLAKDANQYEKDGLSIKAKKADKEIKNILDLLFVNNRQISSTESCLFKRDTFDRETFGEGNCFFRLNCYEPPITHDENYKKNRIVFQIFSKNEFGNKLIVTSSDIVEKFEEADLFTGKIIITNQDGFGLKQTYRFERNLGFGPKLTVFCKMVSFTSIVKQPAQAEKEVLSPGELLRKLESGDLVPKSEIIKTLKSLIDKGN